MVTAFGVADPASHLARKHTIGASSKAVRLILPPGGSSSCLSNRHRARNILRPGKRRVYRALVEVASQKGECE
jgi:hypothetical protein